jgi:hypothetical protein
LVLCCGDLEGLLVGWTLVSGVIRTCGINHLFPLVFHSCTLACPWVQLASLPLTLQHLSSIVPVTHLELALTLSGRNWQFLWQAAAVPKWAVVVLIVIFFIGIWGILMGILIKYSKVHSWLLPVFAIGLGAPRWCQMWWGTSGMGLYLPWAGKAGPYV